MSEIKPIRKSVAAGFFFIFGIVFPVAVVAFEAVTHTCAGVLFDPLATPGHFVLTLLAPAVNLTMFILQKKNIRLGVRWLGVLNGAALFVAGYYMLLFIPILPFATFALVLIFSGIGFLGLMAYAPLLCFISTLRYRRAYKKAFQLDTLPGLWLGLLAGVALLGAVSLPSVVTQVGLKMAVSENEKIQQRGVAWLRDFGSESELHKACYGRHGNPIDPVGLLMWLDGEVSTARTRDVYYRVTGENYEDKSINRRNGWLGDDFGRFGGFDAHQGGDEVGTMVKGLSLQESRMDGSVNADDALAYLEWTMVFKNTEAIDQEARLQMQLPPDAVVSRLTLWIDGEPREAAFGGRSQTKQAYKSVVQRRRDPVLVTTDGLDRVLVQCFPVPRDGGTMKIRVGITVPLQLDTAASARLYLPHLITQNFELNSAAPHRLFLASKSGMTSPFRSVQQNQRDDGTTELIGDVADSHLREPNRGVHVARNPLLRKSETVDWTETNAKRVHQVIEPAQSELPRELFVVVDGSKAMATAAKELAVPLQRLAKVTRLRLFIASDTVMTPALPVHPSTQAMTDALTQANYVGGQNNEPALRQALLAAAKKPNATVLWIHGPMTYALSAGEGVTQLLTRLTAPPKLLSLQAVPGENKLLDGLAATGRIQMIRREDNVPSDVMGLAERWTGATTTWRARRFVDMAETTAVVSLGASESHDTTHLARLWALDEIREDYQSGDAHRLKRATERSVHYRLVTPVSGAVVLETQQQYDAADLSPVNPGEVPTVPEPHEWVLIFLALLFIGYALLRHRRARA